MLTKEHYAELHRLQGSRYVPTVTEFANGHCFEIHAGILVTVTTCGDNRSIVYSEFHANDDSARADFDARLNDARTREYLERTAKLFPDEILGDFAESIRSGNSAALAALTDYLAETRGETDGWTLMAKSAHHHVQGESNVECKIDGETYLLNATDGYKYSDKTPKAARITPGDSVEIMTIEQINNQPTLRVSTFSIGDYGRTGSYNLIYTDPIEKITLKTITFANGGRGGRKRVMKMVEFIEDHAFFSYETALKNNREMSMSI